MTPREEKVFREALELPPLERAALVEQLLRSFDPEPSVTSEIETAWVSEAHDRMAAYESGEITARSEDDVFADIDRKYNS
ncbi:MAG: addiction module protein [Armatimonadota bacterium]